MAHSARIQPFPTNTEKYVTAITASINIQGGYPSYLQDYSKLQV
ncbi:hypothetical protein XBO1_1970025 [Xenorhabdus bovienii str. oregonense]|uniref:Uncharacterized protein n=1 Tax=Xenorhabdus bovienii str. oregonense TaxID=1398202 RepID=A0A077P4E0_XENBV|nr:hypothetical protein XBO1_1970025 [Xenorhabdus bovienii str. oregonense]